MGANRGPSLHWVPIDTEKKIQSEGANWLNSVKREVKLVGDCSLRNEKQPPSSCGEPELRSTRRLLTGAEHTFLCLQVLLPVLPAQLAW